MPLGRVPWIAWPTNSMNARAAGDALRARRQTSVTGRRTAGRRLRTSMAGPSSVVRDRGRIAQANPGRERSQQERISALQSEVKA